MNPGVLESGQPTEPAAVDTRPPGCGRADGCSNYCGEGEAGHRAREPLRPRLCDRPDRHLGAVDEDAVRAVINVGGGVGDGDSVDRIATSSRDCRRQMTTGPSSVSVANPDRLADRRRPHRAHRLWTAGPRADERHRPRRPAHPPGPPCSLPERLVRRRRLPRRPSGGDLPSAGPGLHVTAVAPPETGTVLGTPTE